MHKDVSILLTPAWLHAIIFVSLAERIRPFDAALLAASAVSHTVCHLTPKDIVVLIFAATDVEELEYNFCELLLLFLGPLP